MGSLSIDKKLENFIDVMISEATDQSGAITEALRQKEAELMAKAEAQIEAETQKHIRTRIAEISAAENHRVSTRMTENQHTLLEFREKSAQNVYADVAQRVAEFTASPDYLPHLKMLLAKAIETFGYGYSAEILLRREDMKFADELISSATGVSLSAAEGSFSLGGLCFNCFARGKRIDLTFDSALQDIKGHFSDYAGIQITQN